MCKVPGTGDEYPSFAEIGDEIKSVDEKVCTKEIRGTLIPNFAELGMRSKV